MEKHFLAKLFGAAVMAADPLSGIKRHLPEPPLNGRTVVIGAGKGAAQMARALEKLWAGPLSGVVVTRYGYGCSTCNIEVVEAAHPIPDEAGLSASTRLINAISDLTEEDLVIALISGGGSSLLPAPPAGLSLADEIAVNKALLESGVPIAGMNVIRKHVSRNKGGRLAAATRARVVTLLVSDIPGDDPAAIASGPTIPSHSTPADALDLVSYYGLSLPPSVIKHLHSRQADAPKPTDPVFANHLHHIIASASASLDAAADLALRNGIEPAILSDSIEGEARDVAQVHAAIAREVLFRSRPFTRPVVLLSGGETVVSMRGDVGRGGRNTEFALAMALALEGCSVEVLAADTDGIDGSETNAGAFADGTTVGRLRAAGLDPRKLLESHNSYAAFSALGDTFSTGPTGTNVNDFRAILIR